MNYPEEELRGILLIKNVHGSLSRLVCIPDPRSGEAVKAFIQLKPELEATEKEIIAFCKEKLTGYKRPRTVEFRETLPTRPLHNALFCPITASGSNFNPRNTQCIPVVEIIAFLVLGQNRTFFKGLATSVIGKVLRRVLRDEELKKINKPFYFIFF